ncbi:hypothetical protein BDA99DRAFT_438424 [Phascolomyces articulosus]|uniref:Zinc finger PHD-type domain-containing protein n=1 Tax=Phascolomyces articulosus TaxID=60185 RepID=A0AAD5K0J8_9FUNG|nr:hypothetical protein BDA99DRAFT_438424 [Phascolomyces articulosus]
MNQCITFLFSLDIQSAARAQRRAQQQQQYQQQQQQQQQQEIWCICREPAHGKMIQCDNDQCHYQWFHFSCVGLKKAPKGDWYCEEYQNQHKDKKQKK